MWCMMPRLLPLMIRNLGSFMGKWEMRRSLVICTVLKHEFAGLSSDLVYKIVSIAIKLEACKESHLICPDMYSETLYAEEPKLNLGVSVEFFRDSVFHRELEKSDIYGPSLDLFCQLYENAGFRLSAQHLERAQQVMGTIFTISWNIDLTYIITFYTLQAEIKDLNLGCQSTSVWSHCCLS